LANEICKSRNRSKITVNDVLEALDKAGFDKYASEIENLSSKYYIEIIKIVNIDDE